MIAARSSLRGALSALTVVLALLTLVVVAALALLANRLQRVSGTLGAAVESIRLVEEAEIALLLHARSDDPIARGRFENDMLGALAAARVYVTDDEELEAVDRAAAAAVEYLAGETGDVNTIYRLIDRVVDINVAQSDQAKQASRSWSRLGTLASALASVALVLVTGGALWWLRARAFRPIVELAGTVERYGRGDRAARAPEAGSVELVEIGRRFNEMAANLESQREARVAFLGRVAHDLRNPITALRMQAQRYGPDDPPPDGERLRRLLEVLNRQITRLDRMLGDLLDSARVEAGKLELRLIAEDLRPVVRDACAPFVDLSPQHALEVVVPEGEVRVRCDRLRFEQVIANLVSNAIKYSPSGGTVRVALEAHDGEAAVAVTDEGIGISEADRARLFEPFRRVGISREGVPGVGLGLYGVRKIVEAHGGCVEVDSAPGRGSTFRVTLPLAAA
jgi:signal transduction histidine kinase